MNVDLSRRAAGVKSAPCIIHLSPKDKFDLAQAVTAAVDFQSLSSQYQQLILQAESELSGSYKRTATFRVGTKGSAKSGNYGHAGRQGKVGGSAPKSKGGDNIAQPKYTKLEDMPCFKAYDPYDPPRVENQDATLKLILHDQGFDGLPDVVSKEEMDKYVQAGETEIFRGLQGRNAEQFAYQFRGGDLFVGMGSHGSGTYSSTDSMTAWSYADSGKGAILRMTLKPGAKIIDEDKVDILRNKETKARTDKYEAAKNKLDEEQPKDYTAQYEKLMDNNRKTRRMVGGDNGRWAAIHGYDAIAVGAGEKEVYYVVLNRTALRVQSTNYVETESME